MIFFENDYLKYGIRADGRNLNFVDKLSGNDICESSIPGYIAQLKKNGRYFQPTSVSLANGILTVDFSDARVKAQIRVSQEKQFLTCEVVSLTGDGVEELSFPNISIKADEKFVGCALALNLQTNVLELPQPNTALRAYCYQKFGFPGAKVAIIGCPKEELRAVMQAAVTTSPDLPHSKLGGPWAMDAPINQGSYFFNFDGITVNTADEWIALAKSLGINQIDFHGGYSFRFGDFRPNPVLYPNGRADLKAAIDKLHAAGIKAGFHTYAFFIHKDCPYVTPIPDPGLGKDATFTLTEKLTPDATTVPTAESTDKMSTTTGFFIRNSVTLQIDNELIIYTGIAKHPPFTFTGCQRGAYGTKVSAHEKGAKIYHLKECFGLFAPDGESPLMEKIAQQTAETFNECGFDMIYLDALDGEDILSNTPGESWHYGSMFVFDIWRYLDKPALQEMSTFHHHLWYVRSRMGAWDHPNRSHKRYIDIHCTSNEGNTRMFLPGQLGWWALLPKAFFDTERTYTDDLEYLCAKAAGTECGISIMGVSPDTIKTNSGLTNLAATIKGWEDLRNAGFFTASMKSQLREPGKDFTLTHDKAGKPEIRSAEYKTHKYESTADRTSEWTVTNRFADQTPGIRIEALQSMDFDDPHGQKLLTDFTDIGFFNDRETKSDIVSSLTSSSEGRQPGESCGIIKAIRKESASVGTPVASYSQTEHGIRSVSDLPCGWVRFGRRWDTPTDLGEAKGIGVWINGDGLGEVLNFQVKSPPSVGNGINDHYVTIDFTGWRYFEMLEPEGERSENYCWPYAGNVYALYREGLNYNKIESFSIWLTNLPADQEVNIRLSPVKALPPVLTSIQNPKVKIGNKTIEFPMEIESGGYLEFKSLKDCKLYALDGKFVRDVSPTGEIPTLKKGNNNISFEYSGTAHPSHRAKITIISTGDAIH